MKKSLIYLIIGILSFSAKLTFAKIEKFTSQLSGNSLYSGAILSNQDASYPFMVSNPTTWQSSFINFNVKNEIILKIDPDYTGSSLQTGAFDIDFDIEYKDANFTTHYINNIQLTVEYNNNQTSIDLNHFSFSDGHEVKIIINSISSNLGFLKLESHIEVERYYEISLLMPVSGITASLVSDPENVIQFNWPNVTGAEEYELEWTFVGNYGLNGTPINGLDLKFDFKRNSTNVIVKNNSYKIANVFERGYVVYRYRAIGRLLTNPNIKCYSFWSNAETGIVGLTGSVIAVNPHMSDNMNWQFSASYAENGKLTESAAYFDGLSMERQSLVKAYTINRSILAQTYFDHYGRPAVIALPAPTDKPSLNFRANFNRNPNNNTWGKLDFDLDPQIEHPCGVLPTKMNEAFGISKYYSTQNSEKDGSQAFVPNAEGYPFFRKEFTPDATGRISRIGAAGSDFQLGMTHETWMFYGTAIQDKLNKLFGTDAGSARQYFQTTTKDPNGQISNTYTDLKGRTIATSLSGTLPSGIDPIEGNLPGGQTAVSTLIDATTTQSQPDDRTLLFNKTFVASSDGNYEFEYELTTEQFTDVCLPSNICFDCVYDLKITIRDENCGGEILLEHNAIINGLPFDTACSSGPALPRVYRLSEDLGQSFSAYLKAGQYSITKELKVNEDAINYYTQRYLNNNTCLKTYNDFYNEFLLDVDLSLCDADYCDMICRQQLGTRAQFISNGGTSQEYDIQMALLKENCILTQKCESEKRNLLMDFFIGGQYARFEMTSTGDFVATDPMSILNENNSYPGGYDWRNPFSIYKEADGTTSTMINGLGQTVSPTDPSISLKDFILGFKMSWAESFLEIHPEFCFLSFCTDNQSSHDYDYAMKQVKTLQEAIQLGFINPLNLNTSQGLPYSSWSNANNIDPFFQNNSSLLSQAISKLQNYANSGNTTTNIWQMSYAMLNCTDPNVPLSTCLQNYSFDPNSCYADMLWTQFRDLYFIMKEDFYQLARTNYSIENKCFNGCIGNQSFDPTYYNFNCYNSNISPDCSTDPSKYNGFIDSEQPCNQTNNVLWENYYPHYSIPSLLSLNGISTTSFLNLVEQEMTADHQLFCNEICTDVVESWIEALNGCNLSSLSTQDYNNLVAELEEFCGLGCSEGDVNNLATFSLPPNVNTSNGNHTIGEVLEDYLGVNYESSTCNSFLLHSPTDVFNNSNLQSIDLDTCVCDKIKNAQHLFSLGLLPSGVTNVEEYFNHEYNVPLSNFSTVECACNDAWTEVHGSTSWSESLSWKNEGALFLENLPTKIKVPAILSCPKCISCEEIYPYMQQFYTRFPTALGAANEYELIAGYLNEILGLYFQPIDYLEFLEECDLSSVIVNCEQNQAALDLVRILDIVAHEGRLFDTPDLQEWEYYITSVMYNYNPSLNNPQPDHRLTINSTYKNDNSIHFTWGDGADFFCNISITLNDPNLFLDWQNLMALEFVSIPPVGCNQSSNQLIANAYFNIRGREYRYEVTIESDCFNFSHCTCTFNNEAQLCEEVIYEAPEGNDCVDILLQQVEDNAKDAYEDYIEDEIAKFKKKYIEHCINSTTEYLVMVSAENEYHTTLYYYDQAGNLYKTISPKGIDDAFYYGDVDANRLQNIPDKPIHHYATQYRYNSQAQLKNVHTVDGSLTKYWYDMAGRLVLSQNHKQLIEDKYSYTKYDNAGRLIEIGEVQKSPSTPINQTVVDIPNFLEAWINSGTRREVTRTFYDQSLDPAIAAKFTNGQNNLRLRVSTVAYYDLYNGADLVYNHATHYSYDQHGNAKEIIQDNPELTSLGQETAKIEYDFELISGNVQKVSYQKGKKDAFYHQYNYDADNRLTEVLTSHNDVIWDSDARYHYYWHGPLARIERGEHKIQGEDFAYTINGWLKGVNSNVLSPGKDMGKDGTFGYLNNQNNVHLKYAPDKIGYTLGYFDGDFKAISNPSLSNNFEAEYSGSTLSNSAYSLYNGNIRMTAFSIADLAPQAYSYSYDQLQRIKSASTYRGLDVVANSWMASTYTEDYKSQYTYDKNGNILSLFRNAYGSNLYMDDLTYNYYDYKNQLKSVNDAIASVSHNVDIDDHLNSSNYYYNLIGELTADVSQKIGEIKWTASGKIKSIERTLSSGTNTEVEFKYDAFGNRIQKIVKPSYNGTPLSPDQWTYTYYVRDPQGNIMATYDKKVESQFEKYYLNETSIYGSSRLGVKSDYKLLATYDADSDLLTTETIGNESKQRKLGQKNYEFTDHLGNVMVVATDKKLVYDELGHLIEENNFASGTTEGWAPSPGNSSYLTLTPQINNLKINATQAWRSIYKNFTTTPGNSYKLTLKVDKGTANSVNIRINNQSTQNMLTSSWNIDAAGIHTKDIIFTAQENQTTVLFDNTNGSASEYYLKEVKFYDLGTLSSVQQMTTSASSWHTYVTTSTPQSPTPTVTVNPNQIDISGSLYQNNGFQAWKNYYNLEIGKLYKVSFTTTIGSGNTINMLDLGAEAHQYPADLIRTNFASPTNGSNGFELYFIPVVSQVKIVFNGWAPNADVVYDFSINNLKIEEVTNLSNIPSNFTTSSAEGWTPASSAVTQTLSTAELKINTTQAWQGTYKIFNTEIGKQYKLRATVNKGTADGLVIRAENTNNKLKAGNWSITTTGTVEREFIFTATENTTTVRIDAISPNTTEFFIYSADLVELGKNPHIIPASMPSAAWSVHDPFALVPTINETSGQTAVTGTVGTGKYFQFHKQFSNLEIDRIYKISFDIDLNSGHTMPANYLDVIVQQQPSQQNRIDLEVPVAAPNKHEIFFTTKQTSSIYVIFGCTSPIANTHVNFFIKNLKIEKLNYILNSPAYEANVMSFTDYYPFGMAMPGRTYNNGAYSFGYNTQEKVDEIAGAGNHYTAQFWEYDPRVIHRWNRDPEWRHFVYQSPYVINMNNPIIFNDPLGDFPIIPFLVRAAARTAWPVIKRNSPRILKLFGYGIVASASGEFSANFIYAGDFRKAVGNMDVIDILADGGINVITCGAGSYKALFKFGSKLSVIKSSSIITLELISVSTDLTYDKNMETIFGDKGFFEATSQLILKLGFAHSSEKVSEILTKWIETDKIPKNFAPKTKEEKEIINKIHDLFKSSTFQQVNENGHTFLEKYVDLILNSGVKMEVKKLGTENIGISINQPDALNVQLPSRGSFESELDLCK